MVSQSRNIYIWTVFITNGRFLIKLMLTSLDFYEKIDSFQNPKNLCTTP
jgi:hypothetical protein